jgi:CDP-diacylglycerol--glycerol-3-phosphate 3-phosphatidyltransferase
VDGYVARRFHQKSELGAVLDPLADKLLLVCAIVLLSLDHPHFNTIPLWLTITIISRDLLLLAGAIIISITCGRTVVRPRWSGKIATVLQMILVVWTMLNWSEPFANWMALAATAFTAWSGFLYLLDGIQQLSASPQSAPAPRQ